MKVVRRIHAHIDVREAAQHIQDVVRAPPVDDEADAAGAYLRVRPAGFREGVGDVAVDLEAEVIVEVEPEPAANSTPMTVTARMDDSWSEKATPKIGVSVGKRDTPSL